MRLPILGFLISTLALTACSTAPEDGGASDTLESDQTASVRMDAAFGELGSVKLQVPCEHDSDVSCVGSSFATALARQADGKYLVAGRILTWTEGIIPVDRPVPKGRYFVARLEANGQPDVTFATAGFAVHELDDLFMPTHLVVQRSGKLLLIGRTHDFYNSRGAMIRLTAEGGVDPSFHGGASVKMDIACRGGVRALCSSTPDALFVDTDESLYVSSNRANFRGSNNGLERYSADGDVDAAFSAAFSAAQGAKPYYNAVGAIEKLPDGRLFILADGGAVVLKPSGEVDTSVGPRGRINLPLGVPLDLLPRVITRRADGSLVIGGISNSVSYRETTSSRLLLMTSPGSFEAAYNPKLVFPKIRGTGNFEVKKLFNMIDGRTLVVGLYEDAYSRGDLYVYSVDAVGNADLVTTLGSTKLGFHFYDAILDGNRLMVVGAIRLLNYTTSGVFALNVE